MNLFAALLFKAVAAAHAADAVAADCHLAPPAAYITQPASFDAGDQGASVRLARDDGWREVWIAGSACHRRWAPPSGEAPRKITEIHWLYRRQLQALGAEIVFRDWRHTVARVPIANGTRWIQIYTPPGAIELTVVDDAANTRID